MPRDTSITVLEFPAGMEAQARAALQQAAEDFKKYKNSGLKQFWGGIDPDLKVAVGIAFYKDENSRKEIEKKSHKGKVEDAPEGTDIEKKRKQRLQEAGGDEEGTYILDFVAQA